MERARRRSMNTCRSGRAVRSSVLVGRKTPEDIFVRGGAVVVTGGRLSALACGCTRGGRHACWLACALSLESHVYMRGWTLRPAGCRSFCEHGESRSGPRSRTTWTRCPSARQTRRSRTSSGSAPWWTSLYHCARSSSSRGRRQGGRADVWWPAESPRHAPCARVARRAVVSVIAT